MTMPSFFIMGAPKSGTTALHVALDRHPQLHMSGVKEPKHFLFDGPPPRGVGPGDERTYRAAVWQRATYEDLFAQAPPDALCGESTSLYLHDRQAPTRIRAAVPDARLIALLRDPVDRAHSNWTHLWSAGLEPERDFVTACELEQQRTEAGWAAFWRYLELGLYGEQLERLYAVFPREQVLLIRYGELRDRPAQALDRVSAFLGVQTGLVSEVPAANVTTHASDTPRNRALSRVVRSVSSVAHHLPERVWSPLDRALGRTLQAEQRERLPITPDERAALLPHFSQDIDLLEQLTGEGFDRWRDVEAEIHATKPAPVGRIGTSHNSIDRPLSR